MRRFTFYIFAAFFTFAVGCIIVFGLLYKENPKEVKTETKENLQIRLNENKTSTSLDYDLFKAQYENRFPKPVEKQIPFCEDKRILPIWNLIKNDEQFLGQGDKMFLEPNCSNMFKIFNFDLNKDGKKEIILRGDSPDLCSAVGNCGFWIFEKKGRNYRKILSSTDYTDVNEMGDQIEESKTKGYYDVLLKGHLSASDTSYEFFKFNGKKYKTSKSLVHACTVCVGDNPKWEFITWKEYENRNH